MAPSYLLTRRMLTALLADEIAMFSFNRVIHGDLQHFGRKIRLAIAKTHGFIKLLLTRLRITHC